MSESVKITDPCDTIARDMADDKDISKKEAIARIFQEAGYDV